MTLFASGRIPFRLFPSDEQQAMQELKALLQGRLAAAERDQASSAAGAEHHRLRLLKDALSSAFAASEEAYRPLSAEQVMAGHSDPAAQKPEQSPLP